MSNSFDESGPPPAQDGEYAEPRPQETGPPPVPVVSCDQEETAKQRFSLSKFNGIYVGLVLVFCVVAFIAEPGKSSYQIGYHMGGIVAFCLFPLLIAWIAWRCSGRRAKAGSLAFNLTLTLCLLGQVGQFMNRPREDRTRADIERKTEAFRKEVANTKDPSKLRSAQKKYVDSIKDSFEDSAGKSTGAEKRARQILSQDFNETMAAVQEWGESRVAAQSAMDFSHSPLTDDKEFDRRKSALGLYIKKSKAYIEFYTNRVPNLTKRLAALGQENQFVRGAIDGARAQYLRHKPIYGPLMQAHIAAGNIAIQILGFLQKNKEKWEYKNDRFLFSSDSALTEFSELQKVLLKNDETIQALSIKLQKAQ